MSSNNIALISKYLPLLDRKYQAESKTGVLDLDMSLAKETLDAKSILLPKMVLQGLADYDRNGGYVTGDMNLSWQTHTFTQDRGRMFNIDTMDDLETAFLLFANVAGEFIRLHVAPELDSYRFSRYAGLSGHDPDTTAPTKANVLSLIIGGRTALVDKQVPLNSIFIFATPKVYGDLMLSTESSKERSIKIKINGIELEIPAINGMPIIEVPSERMMTAYTFLDGTTTGQTQGGITPAPNAKQINFMMLSKASVMQIVKRAQPKIVNPEDNQKSDGWLFGYRLYHDAFVPDNKRDGIYVNREA